MAPRNKPYEQFGPFVLFKKLETDSLGDLWRAGYIDGGEVRSTVALRRFTGGSRAALTTSVESAAKILPQLTGSSFARNQRAGVIDGVPYVAWEYGGGRSLRQVIDRARGGNGAQPNPLPLDQAMVIAERVALSLATTADLRDAGSARLQHGALVPQFIWISDDGDIRVAGQTLGSGMAASLADAKVAGEIARYFPPEQRTGAPSKQTDIYSLGAILFLLVTGQEPPDAATASAFATAVRAAKTTTGAEIPADIRGLLDKSFNVDPSMRYASVGEMKQAVNSLANSGRYSATTFNLAFYLSNLLKKEMETEALEREKESKINAAAYTETPRPAGPVAPTPEPAMFAAAAQQAQAKSKAPLFIGVAAAIALVGGGAGFMMWKKQQAAPTTPATTSAAMIPAPVKPRVISEPVVATTSAATATAANDPAAQKAAFEEAVRQKMQAEMMKLQDQFMTELKQKQSKNAPVPTSPAPAPAQQVADDSLSAAKLDQQRLPAAREERPAAAATTPVQQQVAQQIPQQAPAVQPAPSTPAPAPSSSVHEGDVVDVASLDTVPRPLRPLRPEYPAMAAQLKVSATIILTALIDENGTVSDVRVLRGNPRFGLNDSAMRAMRAAKFSSPMKDGKRVRTWMPQTIDFRP